MEKRDKTTITTVYLEDDVLEHSKNNPCIKSLSNWFNSTYKKEFMRLEKAKNKLKDNLIKAEYLRKEIKRLKKEEENIPKIVSKKAVEWIRNEGVARAKNATVEGVLKFFNNKFNEKLTLRQFKILLKEAER